MTFQAVPITPKQYNVKKIRDRITGALLSEGKKQVEMLEQTVQHWKGNKPKFEATFDIDRKGAYLLVGPSGDTEAARIWGYLNDGTKPHIITPKRAPALAFRVPYRAGSQPNMLKTRPSQRGSRWVRTQIVRHPGNEPRNWTEVVYKRRRDKLIRDVNHALVTGMEEHIWG